MADSPAAIQPGTVVAPVAPPATQPGTVSPSNGVELTEEAKAAGFTAEDFENPQYGPKARTLYKGFQEKAERAAKVERDLNEITRFIQSNPEIVKAIKTAYVGGQAPELEPERASGNEPDPMAEIRLVKVDRVLDRLYSQLGKGDYDAGKALFDKDYVDDVTQVVKMLNPSLDPGTKLTQAMNIVMAQRGAAKPPVVVDPAATSGLRGGGSSAPPKEKPIAERTDADIREAAFRAAGITREEWDATNEEQ